MLSKSEGPGPCASAIPSFFFSTFYAWTVGLEALALAASLPLRCTVLTVAGVLDLLSLGLLINGVSSGIHSCASNCANNDTSADGG
jgi:hypothetical protein